MPVMGREDLRWNGTTNFLQLTVVVVFSYAGLDGNEPVSMLMIEYNDVCTSQNAF
jgi:hypothetical protein